MSNEYAPAAPLALIRAHLNLDDDRDSDLLTHCAHVAAHWVQAHTGQPFGPDSPLMAQAALLPVAHQYEAREAVSFASGYRLPFWLHDLLSPLKDRITGHQPEAV